MGESSNNALYIIAEDGRTVRFDGLQTADLQAESDCGPTLNLTTEFKTTEFKMTFPVTLRMPTTRSRKRFVKRLMARGISRNQANAMAASYHRHGYSWSSAYIDFLWLHSRFV